jgi:MOSC domain-containing protein YiiM
MTGKIVSLYMKVKHGERMQPAKSLEAESGMGILGDVSYGRAKRQVLFVELETLDEFGLVPGQVRENVTVSGFKLAGLAPGSQLQVGQALFVVVGDWAPCQQMEGIRPGLQEEINGRRGTLCRVVNGGSLKEGDQVALVDNQ